MSSENIVVCFTCFIKVFSTCMFISSFLNFFIYTKVNNKIIFYTSVILSGLSTFYRYYNRNFMNILMFCFLLVVFSIYQESQKKKLFFIIFTLVLVIFSNSIYMCMNSLFFQYLHFMNGDHWIRFLSELIQPFVLSIIYFYFKRYNLYFKNCVLKDKEWNLYIIMTVSAICYLLLVNYFMWKFDIPNNINKLLVFIGFILFIMITYYLFFLYLRNTYRKNRELMEVKQKLDTQEFNSKLYDQMKESYEANRKLKHDLVGHVGMIKELMDVDVEKAKDYIDQLYGHIDKTSIAMSESEAINCILNSRCDRIKKENISVKYELESTLDTIKDFDLTIILGNLFDNAIEAQAYVEDKRIRVQIWEDDKYHYINFINHCNTSMIHEENGEFKTTKTKDVGMHGIGISNVKECVKWYHGQFQQSIQGGNFISSIYIPRHFE